MKLHDCLLGILIFVAGIIIFYVAREYPDQNDGKPGPWLFPVVLSLMFAVSGLILCLKGYLKSRHDSLISFNKELSKHGVFNIAVLILLVLFFIYASDFLGFLITMEIIILCLMFLMKTKPLPALIVSVCATVGIYLIFSKALLVPLPQGLLSF